MSPTVPMPALGRARASAFGASTPPRPPRVHPVTMRPSGNLADGTMSQSDARQLLAIGLATGLVGFAAGAALTYKAVRKLAGR
jgi:hypothetical protein